MRNRHFIATFSAGLALAFSLRASTPSIVYSLATLPQSAAPAAKLAVQFTAMNLTDLTVEVVWPATMAGTLAVSSCRWNVTFTADRAGPSSHLLAPSEFTSRVYHISLPSDALAGAGFLEARLPDSAPMRMGLVIEDAGTSPILFTRSTATQPTSPLVHPEPAVNALSRTFAERIGPHEPIYLIFGPDDPAAKFQFSLKYKIMDLGHGSRKWVSRTVQFGYTQCSLWDIGAESSPFHDTSYMPELMLEALTPVSERDGYVNWLGFQAGYKHESNGRDGPFSRSVNIAQLQAGVALGDLDGWHAIVVPRMWTYLETSEYNHDIEDYRGYGMLRVILGRNDGPAVSISTWAGRDLEHGSLQLDLNVPVRLKVLDLKTYLLLQYFNGYGESLRDYGAKSETIRAGFAIVR